MIFSLPGMSSTNRVKHYRKVLSSSQTSFFNKAEKGTKDLVRELLHKIWSYANLGLSILCLLLIFAMGGVGPWTKLLSPLDAPLRPLTESKKGYEVFGFAPYWNKDKLGQVNFGTLTTLSYFGVPVLNDGTLDESDPGYITFLSDTMTKVFQKAHAAGTRVVLTVTQMDNNTITSFLDSSDAQKSAIDQIIATVKARGIDGVNVDFEYLGDPGSFYRTQFSQFVADLTTKMHQEMPRSQVTVSVYALAARGGKLYDIASLGKSADEIFMMAYDFAVAGSDNAAPTAPLYGYKEGKYSYDISTAVADFLRLMPANKLVLGVPYYGYNYLVYKPGVNALTRPYDSWRGTPTAQTYSYVLDNVKSEVSGWDNVGKVGWKAYFVPETGTWRMIFLDDPKSLAYKYDFVKTKGLGGVGIWALGNDNNKPELWALLRQKFGIKLADSSMADLPSH